MLRQLPPTLKALSIACVIIVASNPYAYADDKPTSENAWLQPPCSFCCQTPEEEKELIIKFSPYFWLTRMHGDLGVRGLTVPLDVTMGKMWDLITHDLDFAFLGQLEASYGRVGVLANGVYFALNPDTDIRNFNFDKRVSQTALDVDITYTLFGQPETRCGENFRFDLLTGIRYYSLTGDITITGPRGNQINDSGAVAWTDLVLGGRFVVPVNEKWSFYARGDAGGFGINGSSQFAWNVELLANYRYSETVTLFAGYRWLDVDFSRGAGRDRFVYDVQTDGPQVGVTIRF